MDLHHFALEWYALLSRLNAAVTEPLGAVADAINVPVVSALLFGVLGATAPCQLTTNASAMAFVARRAGSRQAIAGSALGYLLGKMLVYTVLGLAVTLAGQRLAQQSIPVIVAARKVLGPAMILLGLYFSGAVPLRFSLGFGLANRLEARARAGAGAGAAFVLGTAFSFAFCPTLFLLFFGLTLPLALASPAGAMFPGVFALGTTLPLLVVAALLAARTDTDRGHGYVRGVRRAHRWIRPLVASVLVLAGLNDTITYWLL